MSMTWGQLSGSLVDEAKKRRLPISGQFELTARCNLRCKMCYVCKTVNDKEAILCEKTASEWIQLAREAREAGMLYLLLTGGEVFLRQDFKEIYEKISQMGFITTIYTNGTMITPDIAKWLGGIPPSSIEMTLYGASAETYQKVCGDGSGFEKALRSIDLLLNEGIDLKLRTTVIRENVSDFQKLAEFAEKRQLQLGIVNYVSPRREGNITYPEGERLSPRELAKFEINVKKFYMNKSKVVSKDTPIDIHFDESNQAYDNSKSRDANKNEGVFYCTASKCSFWITWDGKMTPCSLMAEPATTPFVRNFVSAWNELQQLCSSIPECSDCIQCNLREYCMTCPARNKNETSFYDMAGYYLCELAENRRRLKFVK
jgi:MoaA/NifB/PqqE/SkfB family radical SAM enzyme